MLILYEKKNILEMVLIRKLKVCNVRKSLYQLDRAYACVFCTSAWYGHLILTNKNKLARTAQQHERRWTANSSYWMTFAVYLCIGKLCSLLVPLNINTCRLKQMVAHQEPDSVQGFCLLSFSLPLSPTARS